MKYVLTIPAGLTLVFPACASTGNGPDGSGRVADGEYSPETSGEM